MSILAHHTTQSDHVYEPLCLVIYSHHMKSLVMALISVTGEYGAECANNAIIAKYQMKTIFI